MKVRAQLILILLAVVASILALSIGLRYQISKETRALLSQKMTETREQELPEIFEKSAVRIRGYVYYYSAWDEMVAFLAGRKDAAWAREQLDQALSTQDIDYIWVVDKDGNLFYNSRTNPDLPPADLAISPPELNKEFAQAQFSSFFLRKDDRTLEIFAAPVQPTDDKNRESEPAGYLLLGRTIDSAHLASLGTIANDISFELGPANPSLKDQTHATNASFTLAVPLKSISGEPVSSLIVSRSYPILSLYQGYLRTYLFVFLVIVALIGALFYYFSKLIFIRPLTALSSALNQNNSRILIPFNQRNNEFGDLSRLITSSFIQRRLLQDEIEIRKKSEAELSKALRDKETAQSEKIKAEEFLGQQQAILKLHNSIDTLEFDGVIRETIAHSAKTINCERVGIWLYDHDAMTITASAIYSLSAGTYGGGGSMDETQHPAYFRYLRTETIIIAEDALTHPATVEFADDYLRPHGIGALMDVPIRSGDKIIGIVGFEHVGKRREWTISEQVFARSIADIVAITSERRERSRAEAELHKSQVRFEETQELAQIGSWEYDFKTKDIVWSKEMYRIFQLTGEAPGELVDLVKKRFHPDDLAAIRSSVEQMLSAKGTFSIEGRITCPDGKLKHILTIGEIMLDENGKPQGMRGTVQDITKQKEAAMAKSEFLSCMSHEIRTPINGVVGIANLLMEEEMPEKQKEYVRTLNFSAQHLATIVSDILDFSKIESGHMVFEKVSFNLEKNCRYVFNLFAQKAAEKNISFHFSPSPVNDYSLYGDYVRLNQVLSNLLSNAIKFTDRGSVDFSYTVAEDSGDKVKVLFKVKDTGIGIPEKNQKQIFESFTQADETITRQYGGTGLGLTISKKLVELQGGHISLKSAEGQGSEFIVSLTFDKHVYRKEVIQGPTTAEKNQDKDLNGMKILVAEDNHVNAMVLTRFLSKWNITSKVARDGSEAIDFLKQENFDIVLMDIQMPNLDGIEATKIIRQSAEEPFRDILVVAFTADASVDTHRELLRIGFDHCMTKPFNPETLFSFLKKNHRAA